MFLGIRPLLTLKLTPSQIRDLALGRRRATKNVCTPKTFLTAAYGLHMHTSIAVHTTTSPRNPSFDRGQQKLGSQSSQHFTGILQIPFISKETGGSCSLKGRAQGEAQVLSVKSVSSKFPTGLTSEGPHLISGTNLCQSYLTIQ